MRTLPPRILREIRDFVRDSDQLALPEYAKAWEAKIDAILGKNRKRATLKSKRLAPRTKARHDKTAAVRRACVKRAQGNCENCGLYVGDENLEMDHFFGGAKKRSHESFDRCWMLDRLCHRAKTENDPSRDYWLAAFLRHRRRHGMRAVGL